MKSLLPKIGLLFLTAFGTVVSSAQDHSVSYSTSDKKIRFGAFIAPTLSWMRPTANKSDNGEYATSNAGSKVGFTYGLMAEYNFADNYSFVTGLQVNMAGGKIDANRDIAPSDSSYFLNSASFDYKLQYLEIPLALKMKTNEISGFKFFGQIGITPSFLIAKKANYNVVINEFNNQTSFKDENVKLKGTLAVSPILFQMNIGVGAEYPFSDQLSGYVGIFFNNGFAPDVTNPNKYDLPYKASFKDGNVRLNNFALRLGLFF